jgi:hypothetical protein
VTETPPSPPAQPPPAAPSAPPPVSDSTVTPVQTSPFEEPSMQVIHASQDPPRRPSRS